MAEATFTFRVDETLKDAFTKAAKSSDRTGAQLLRDFMRAFVRDQGEQAAHDAWFHLQVETGLQSAEAGRLVVHEDVERVFAALRDETRRRLDSGS